MQLIRLEPSLTAQILRTCNSASFAGHEAVADIFDAVTRMGFYQVYCLVVTLLGARSKSMSEASKGVNVEELWRHSVTVAVSASVVAEASGQGRAEAFTAGLLHDIGKLVLASAEGEAYAGIIQRAKDEGVPLINLERSAFVIDHAELGGELMHRWNLPPEIVFAVRYHHELMSAAPHEQITAVVQVGDMIAHLNAAEDLAQTDVLTPSIAAFEKLQLSPTDVPPPPRKNTGRVGRGQSTARD